MTRAPETGFITVGDTRIAFSVTRSRRRKRTLALKMERDSSVVVFAPMRVSLGAIADFLKRQTRWLAHQADLHRNAPPPCDFTDGAYFSYLGRACIVRVTRGNSAPSSCRLALNRFHVHIPDEKLSPRGVQDEVRLELALWLKKRARVLLKKRLDLWAARMGVRYARLAVTGPEKRWGSCSADNVIRLNWRLLVAPLPVIDYVVVHELAHITHKNHGPRFWACVERAVPDWKMRRKILRGLERNMVL
ncbi:MAG: M48 family metallopeptidase [Alphaproteobacteria bacterium]|nr:M48 family metallopeptidase [Alphaproteobacteria bacterium]